MSRLLVVFVALFGLAACGEKEQVVVYKQGKYQGKPDGRSWDNEPLAYGNAKWTKGDRASWEAEIKARNDTQNENKRIGN
ncbi:MAG TPA: hypothetical protein VFB08_07325 [Burkholderiales bacterium]|nr:hypothetical protein [Burkholderiales bacterium]